MLAIIALVAIAIVALIVLSAAVHILFSPWLLLVGVGILAWISSGRAAPTGSQRCRTGRVCAVLPWPVPRPGFVTGAMRGPGV